MRAVIRAAIAGLALPGVAMAQPTQGSPQPSCRADAARFAVGQPYSDRLAMRAQHRAGTGTVRKIEPGRVYTMEFRADRLNLEVGRRGRIRAVRCG